MVRQEISGLLLTHHTVPSIHHEAAPAANEDSERLPFTHAVQTIRRRGSSEAPRRQEEGAQVQRPESRATVPHRNVAGNCLGTAGERCGACATADATRSSPLLGHQAARVDGGTLIGLHREAVLSAVMRSVKVLGRLEALEAPVAGHVRNPGKEHSLLVVAHGFEAACNLDLGHQLLHRENPHHQRGDRLAQRIAAALFMGR